MTKTTLLFQPHNGQIQSRIARLMSAMAVLLVASLTVSSFGPHAAKQNVVESRLMAAAAGRELPVAHNLASTANFAASAIAIRHWSKSEITVHVVASANDDKTPEQVAALVQAGLNLWNGRFKTVKLTLTDSTDADIQIGFVTPGTLNGGAIGKTDVQFDPDTNEIGHAAIRLDERMPQAKLVQAVGHEMGHALGIQGHSDDKNDLMYPTAHLPVQVTDRDLNTLTIGYTTSPSSATGTAIAAAH